MIITIPLEPISFDIEEPEEKDPWDLSFSMNESGDYEENEEPWEATWKIDKHNMALGIPVTQGQGFSFIPRKISEEAKNIVVALEFINPEECDKVQVHLTCLLSDSQVYKAESDIKGRQVRLSFLVPVEDIDTKQLFRANVVFKDTPKKLLLAASYLEVEI